MGPEAVAQDEQVVGQVHAVVVLDGRQMRELQQVLSEHETQQKQVGEEGFSGRSLWPSVECSARPRRKASFASKPWPNVR